MIQEFEDYINTLNQIQLLEDQGQDEADIALDKLKDFIKDSRICPPEAVIKIRDNEIDIKTQEVFKTNRILEIEEFTGFELIFKDQNHYIFRYTVTS